MGNTLIGWTVNVLRSCWTAIAAIPAGWRWTICCAPSIFCRSLPFLKEAELLAADEIMKNAASSRDADEIALLKQAGQLVDEVMDEIRPFLKEGVYEQEIAFKIEFMCQEQRRGSDVF